MDKKDPLEKTAMVIVLEASPRSNKPTRYVRRELIADLEAALRSRGWDIDAGKRAMAEHRKQERKKHVARLDALRKEQEARNNKQ